MYTLYVDLHVICAYLERIYRNEKCSEQNLQSEVK
jgi:hypothetical protein